MGPFEAADFIMALIAQGHERASVTAHEKVMAHYILSLRAPASAERAPEASSACPLCDHDQPHSHGDGQVHAWLKAQAGRFGLKVFVCNESDARAKEAFAVSEDEKARGLAAFEAWFGPRTRHLPHCMLNHNEQPGAEGQYIAIATQQNWNVWEAAWAAKPAHSSVADTDWKARAEYYLAQLEEQRAAYIALSAKLPPNAEKLRSVAAEIEGRYPADARQLRDLADSIS